jgi:cellulose 1,4-beta-cellobiosidase
MSALTTLQSHLTAAAAQGNGNPIVAEFVIYDLPGRDCAALASNGEIPAGGLATYKSQYIDVAVSIFKTAASNIRLSLLIEPDSLPNLATNMGTLRCNSTTQSEYPAGVAYALAQLSALPNTYLYIDAGHGGWLGWPNNQQLIIPIFQNVITLAKAINSNTVVRGFASTTANYDPFDGAGSCPAQQYCPLVNSQYDYNSCIDENLYTQALNAVFSPASLPVRWLVDTSRSGQKTIRYYWGSWCNIKGAGIGIVPTTSPASQVDAFVWVKPPGDSDGVSGPPGTPRLDGHCDPTNSSVSLGASGTDSLSGAPQAGQWFDAEFIMLVDNASPAI